MRFKPLETNKWW